MARSLPRNMRRQINEAAAAVAANRESVIELPARMTQEPEPTDIEQPNTSNSLGRRIRRTFPRILKSHS
jgi:hypothetical protein